jgi:hypothetical protein
MNPVLWWHTVEVFYRASKECILNQSWQHFRSFRTKHKLLFFEAHLRIDCPFHVNKIQCVLLHNRGLVNNLTLSILPVDTPLFYFIAQYNFHALCKVSKFCSVVLSWIHCRNACHPFSVILKFPDKPTLHLVFQIKNKKKSVRKGFFITNYL